MPHILFGDKERALYLGHGEVAHARIHSQEGQAARATAVKALSVVTSF